MGKGKKTLLKTGFPTGQVAEVVISWMLGFWKVYTKDELHIEIDKDLDRKSIDFQLQKRGITVNVQNKFDKKVNSFDEENYAKRGIVVVHNSPDKEAWKGGKPASKNFMRGDAVLFSFLEKSGLYNFDELCDALENEELFSGLLKAWKYLKN